MLMFFCSIFHCFFFFYSSLLCFQVCLSIICPFLAFTLFFFTYLSLFGSILFGGPGGSDLMTYDSTQGNFFFMDCYMQLHSLSLNYLFLYQYICLLIHLLVLGSISLSLSLGVWWNMFKHWKNNSEYEEMSENNSEYEKMLEEASLSKAIFTSPQLRTGGPERNSEKTHTLYFCHRLTDRQTDWTTQ